MNLTEASIILRKFFRNASIASAAVLALIALIAGVVFLYQRTNPPQETPTARFGKLTRPILQPSSQGISFSIETVSGKPPTLPKVLPVYKFSTPTPNLLDADRTARIASSFGFEGSPTSTDGKNLTFTDSRKPGQKLVIDQVSKNFSIQTDNLAGSPIPKTPPPDSAEALVSYGRDLLNSAGLLSADLKKSPAAVIYQKFSSNILISAASVSEGNFARIDIFSDQIGGYPILTSKKGQALISFTISSAFSFQKTIALASFTHWNIESESSSTYPILSVSDAIGRLQAGQAAAATDFAGVTNVIVQNISLGYLETKDYQEYLQPVYLFDGVGRPQNGPEIAVRFLLPAVDPSYFSQ